MPAESAEPREIGERPVLEAETLDVVSEILEQGAPAEQCLAIKTLQAWQAPVAQDLLVKATRNDDPDVRVDALEALVSLEAADLGHVFLWSLENDPVGDAKMAALRGLGLQDSAASETLLRKLILDRSEEDVAWEDETSDWDDWLDVQKEAIRAAGRLGVESAVPDILAAANDEFGQDLWVESLAAFSGLGRPGLMALIDVGQSPSELQRERAARALETSTDPLAVKALEALSQDRSAEVRVAALEATVGRKLPIADWRLIKDPSAVIRRFVAAKSPTVGNVDLVRLATNDESTEVKLAAVRRLTERRPSPDQITDLLVHARGKLRTEPEEFVVALVQVLGRARGDGRFELLLDIQEHNPKPAVQRAVAEALAAFESPESLDILELLVAHESQMVRLSALTSLASLSAGEGEVSDNAAALLFLAAKGNLVAESSMTDAEQDKDEAEKQFGARARDDEGGRQNRVVLDREGNVVSEDPSDDPVRLSDYRKTGDEEAAVGDGSVGETEPADRGAGAALAPIEDDDGDTVLAFPTNTLASILQTDEDQAAFQEEKIDLSEEDLKFLELAQSTIRKRRVRPDVAPNAAIDIRRIAVRLIGELDAPAFTFALLSCAQSSDDELRTAALDAVARRAMRGTGLSNREWEVLNTLPPDNYPQARCAFLAILPSMPTEITEARLKQALQGGEATDVAAALTVCGQLGQAPEEIGSFLSSKDRSIRKAAIGLAFTCDQEACADEVLNAAFSESGALGSVLASELVKSGNGGLRTTLFKKLAEACRAGGVQRQVSLQVLSQIGRQAGLS